MRVPTPSTGGNFLNIHSSAIALLLCSCGEKYSGQKQLREPKFCFSLHVHHRGKLGQVFKQVLEAETKGENFAG